MTLNKKGGFLCIVDFISSYDPWFVQNKDALKKLELPTVQRCMATISMLAHGLPIDVYNEYCRLSESNTRRYLL